jgi:hypothetical protein
VRAREVALLGGDSRCLLLDIGDLLLSSQIDLVYIGHREREEPVGEVEESSDPNLYFFHDTQLINEDDRAKSRENHRSHARRFAEVDTVVSAH